MRLIEAHLRSIKHSVYGIDLLNRFDGNTKQCRTLHEAIRGAFNWEGTPENRHYWQDLHDTAKAGKMDTYKPLEQLALF